MKHFKLSCKRGLVTLLAVALAAPVMAAPDDRGARGDRPEPADRLGKRLERPPENRPDNRPESRPDNRPDNRGDARRETRPSPPRPGAPAPGRPAPPDDRRHNPVPGYNQRYIPPGRVIVLPPRAPPPIMWGGVNYRHWDGNWATPGPRGWITVRPPYGIITYELPSFRTALVIGGLAYLYANGVYYRERTEGGYEVVPPPLTQADAPMMTSPDKVFVYPRMGQTAQQQASDEYECHRWAVTQSGFDPTGVAIGQTVSTNGRSDYQRADAACLEGRGYTVR